MITYELPPPFDDAAKRVHFDQPGGISRRVRESGRVSLQVTVSRINVGSFDDTEAGLEEAKLRYQGCKWYANAKKKPTTTRLLFKSLRWRRYPKT